MFQATICPMEFGQVLGGTPIFLNLGSSGFALYLHVRYLFPRSTILLIR